MKRLLVSLALVVMATGASARDYGEHGGFQIDSIEPTQTDAGGCFMSMEYEGPGDTKLSLIRTGDHPDTIGVFLTNYNWSASSKGEYKGFFYIFDDGSFYDRDVTGSDEDGRHGFMGLFPAQNFLNKFAQSRSLNVYRTKSGETADDFKSYDELNAVDKLRLEGSAAAKAAFDRCWTDTLAQQRAIKREQDRWKDIPKDPFGEAPKREQ